MIYMIIGFFITALLYASVGFGGGSTYNALLILSNVDYLLVPKIALTCNLIVVTGGVIRYQKNDLIPWRITLPLIMVSIPFAWLGGNTLISKEVFLLTLGLSLLFSGTLLLFRHQEITEFSDTIRTKLGIFLFSSVSALLGFFSGLVGIGGGIFFSPMLHLSKALPSKNIAAFASVFIFVNSIAGLAGQFMKDSNPQTLNSYFAYAWLFIAVFIGGLIGTNIGIKNFRPIIVRRLTAVLIIYVGLRLIIGF
jgi:uncharacterized membrane protein YfcA